jgi:hypothetical protein
MDLLSVDMGAARWVRPDRGSYGNGCNESKPQVNGPDTLTARTTFQMRSRLSTHRPASSMLSLDG